MDKEPSRKPNEAQADPIDPRGTPLDPLFCPVAERVLGYTPKPRPGRPRLTSGAVRPKEPTKWH